MDRTRVPFNPDPSEQYLKVKDIDWENTPLKDPKEGVVGNRYYFDACIKNVEAHIKSSE